MLVGNTKKQYLFSFELKGGQPMLKKEKYIFVINLFLTLIIILLIILLFLIIKKIPN